MNNKAGIIMAAILVAVLGALGTAWYVMIVPTFETYKKDERKRLSLEESVKALNDSFGGFKPELLMTAWVNGMQPWRDARTERTKFFSFGDWYKYDESTDKTRMKKFWYGDVTNKMIQDFYTKVYTKMGRYDLFPQDIRAAFGVASEQDWQSRDVTDAEIKENLSRLAFGIKACEFLLDHDIAQLENIVPWPRRVAGEYAEMLAIETLGIQCKIGMRELVKMFEELRTADRYFTVNALKVTYPYIAYNVEPQLQVSMLISQASYMKAKIEGGEAAAQAGAVDTTVAPTLVLPNKRVSKVQQEEFSEPGFIAKSWKWFKNNILYIH